MQKGFSVRMPQEYLDKLDMICAAKDISRSAFSKKSILRSIEEYEQENGTIIIDPLVLQQFRKPGRR
ncbi:ribbon-helix-helix domain-containing protein [bacterium]|nr:ribbon-helix-helix domain-containing protein [bacterium]